MGYDDIVEKTLERLFREQLRAIGKLDKPLLFVRVSLIINHETGDASAEYKIIDVNNDECARYYAKFNVRVMLTFLQSKLKEDMVLSTDLL